MAQRVAGSWQLAAGRAECPTPSGYPNVEFRILKFSDSITQELKRLNGLGQRVAGSCLVDCSSGQLVNEWTCEMGTITFGTSGWRGVIAEDFTFARVRAVPRPLGEYVLAEGAEAARQGVVVGYVTRFLSDAFAQQAATVLAAQGIRVFLTDRDTPTPVVGYEILRRRTAAGGIVTASPNPPPSN